MEMYAFANLALSLTRITAVHTERLLGSHPPTPTSELSLHLNYSIFLEDIYNCGNGTEVSGRTPSSALCFVCTKKCHCRLYISPFLRLFVARVYFIRSFVYFLNFDVYVVVSNFNSLFQCSLYPGHCLLLSFVFYRLGSLYFYIFLQNNRNISGPLVLVYKADVLT